MDDSNVFADNLGSFRSVYDDYWLIGLFFNGQTENYSGWKYYL